MGSVSNIPLTPDKNLKLMNLVPSRRSGVFRYIESENTRFVFEVTAAGELGDAMSRRYIPGSLEIELDITIPEPLTTRASRIVEEEFKTWDNLRILERIQLEIEWLTEMISFLEEDLEIIINNPRDSENGRWDIDELRYLLERIQEAIDQRHGLYKAMVVL